MSCSLDLEETSVAYRAVFAELKALRPRDVRPLDTGPEAVLRTVRRAIPRILVLRPEIEADLPRFDVGLLDRIPTYADALEDICAHHEHLVDEPDQLSALIEAATKERDALRPYLTAYATLGLANARPVRRRRTNGAKLSLAEELGVLVILIRPAYLQLREQSPVFLDSRLDRAERLSTALLRVIGRSHEHSERLVNVGEMRDRAATLLARAYDEIRRAVQFLRPNRREADRIAPCLSSTPETAASKSASAAPPATVAPSAALSNPSKVLN